MGWDRRCELSATFVPSQKGVVVTQISPRSVESTALGTATLVVRLLHIELEIALRHIVFVTTNGALNITLIIQI